MVDCAVEVVVESSEIVEETVSVCPRMRDQSSASRDAGSRGQTSFCVFVVVEVNKSDVVSFSVEVWSGTGDQLPRRGGARSDRYLGLRIRSR